MTDPQTIAEGMTKGQEDYLAAVASSQEPYTPRHGRTANWALRHGLVDTIVRLVDGSEGPWDSFPIERRVAVGIEEVLGQRLTPLGLAVRTHLEKESKK